MYAPAERNDVERSPCWPQPSAPQGFSPNGGTTHERRPSFRFYTVVIGDRRKRSSVRARRTREKAGSSGVQTRRAAPTGQISSRPSEKGTSPGTGAVRRPAPALSGASSRPRTNTRSARRSACSSASARSGACAGASENISAYACSGENIVTSDRPGENSVSSDRPPRGCTAPADSVGAAARCAVQAAPRPAGSFQSTASSPDATTETHQ